MSKGNSGGFSGTKGAKTSFATFPKTIHTGRQEKHIAGSNNFTSGRSVFNGTTKQAEALIKKYSGTGQPLGNNKERVDFGKVIGTYVDESTGKEYPTTMGIIHYSKDGGHIVPARPKEY